MPPFPPLFRLRLRQLNLQTHLIVCVFQNNAQSVGELSLRHSLCSAMPPPGYNRSRPHVLVLTLANGGSYFFQAGTEDLVNEWVLTCNYWAGRTSKEPLLGGVSNMDYGWNRVKGLTDGESKSNRNSLTNDTEDLASVLSGKSGHSRKSKISYAGSISRYSVLGHHSHSARGGEHEGDRITIKDWIPPQPPVTTSTLSEEAQLDSLRKHTAALQKELEQHQNLCVPMQRLVRVHTQEYQSSVEFAVVARTDHLHLSPAPSGSTLLGH